MEQRIPVKPARRKALQITEAKDYLARLILGQEKRGKRKGGRKA